MAIDYHQGQVLREMDLKKGDLRIAKCEILCFCDLVYNDCFGNVSTRCHTIKKGKIFTINTLIVHNENYYVEVLCDGNLFVLCAFDLRYFSREIK